MKLLVLFSFFVFTTVIWVSYAQQDEDKTPKKLQIGVKKRAESCEKKSKKGDVLHMHYRGTLHEKPDVEFDSSYSRNDPFVFTLGAGQVIKGWDRGLLGMCETEERKLVIPADLAYGERGAPPKIPPNAALVFEVTLLKIQRDKDL